MAKTIVDLQKKGVKRKLPKGVRLTKGAKYQIIALPKGKGRAFEGTCLGTINHGRSRLAIFTVPK
jgi:hypothetical protein